MLWADRCPGDCMTNDRNRGDPAGHPRKAARPAADAGRRPPELMTTREVADYLRLKERKVYDLVAGGEIPVSRATGKLLFPRDLVQAWVRRRVEFRDDAGPLLPRPTVFAGSHDPLLDWALRESGSEIATFFDGSLDGLRRLAAGRVIGAGVHLFEPSADPSSGGAPGEIGRAHV